MSIPGWKPGKFKYTCFIVAIGSLIPNFQFLQITKLLNLQILNLYSKNVHLCSTSSSTTNFSPHSLLVLLRICKDFHFRQILNAHRGMENLPSWIEKLSPFLFNENSEKKNIEAVFENVKKMYKKMTSRWVSQAMEKAQHKIKDFSWSLWRIISSQVKMHTNLQMRILRTAVRTLRTAVRSVLNYWIYFRL